MLGYRENWSLRKAVLESINDLNGPADELLTETANIMMDESVSFEAGMLVVDTLTKLVKKRTPKTAVHNRSTNRLFPEIWKRCLLTAIRVILRGDEEVIEKPRPRNPDPYGFR